MKDNNVVDMATKEKLRAPPPVTDFWFAQVDTRLSRIEGIIRRLEWHLWAMFCGIGAVLILSTIELMTPSP